MVYRTVFIIVFLASILLRFDASRLPTYHYNGDYNRDYLVASHIVRYGEMPLAGPNNIVGRYTNSPLYFYLLSLLLLVKNDIVFLSLVNCFLQICALVMVYILTDMVFDRKAALLSFTLFGLSPFIIDELSIPWQPSFMFFFLTLSALLLVFGFTKKRTLLIYLGCFFFVVSVVLHYAALVLFPVYAIVIFIALYTIHKTPKEYFLHLVGIVLVIIASLIVFYLPLVLYIKTSGLSRADFFSTRYIVWDFPELIRNFYIGPAVFLDSMVFPNIPHTLLWGGLVYLSLGIWVLFFIAHTKDTMKNAAVLLLFVSLVNFFMWLSFLIIRPDLSPPPMRYFFPLYIPFILLLSALSTKTRVSFVIVPILLYLFIAPLRILDVLKNVSSNPSDYFNVTYRESSIMHAVQKEIEDKSFRIVSYSPQEREEKPFNDSIFMVFLERQFGFPLTVTDDNTFLGYRRLNDSVTTILFFCETHEDSGKNGEACKEWFRETYPNHSFQKTIYSDTGITVFLTKNQLI